MSRTSNFIAAASDLMSAQASAVTDAYVKHTIKHKDVMVAILLTSIKNIERLAVKHGVSQFVGMTDRQVEKVLQKLAYLAYTRYLNLVRSGASIGQQRAFVRVFSLDRNRRVIIEAASKKL